MKKNKIILSIFLLLSLGLNIMLFVQSLEDSYLVSYHPRLKQDTRILSSLIENNYQKTDIKNNIEKHLPELKVEEKEDIKSMWDWSGPQYPYALTAGGISFYFDSNENLVRVDHWLQVNSPLYERNTNKKVH